MVLKGERHPRARYAGGLHDHVPADRHGRADVCQYEDHPAAGRQPHHTGHQHHRRADEAAGGREEAAAGADLPGAHRRAGPELRGDLRGGPGDGAVLRVQLFTGIRAAGPHEAGGALLYSGEEGRGDCHRPAGPGAAPARAHEGKHAAGDPQAGVLCPQLPAADERQVRAVQPAGKAGRGGRRGEDHHRREQAVREGIQHQRVRDHLHPHRPRAGPGLHGPVLRRHGHRGVHRIPHRRQSGRAHRGAARHGLLLGLRARRQAVCASRGSGGVRQDHGPEVPHGGPGPVQGV